jgi:adenosylmethionine-8-amino-7-oxononanoate aminotransferase
MAKHPQGYVFYRRMAHDYPTIERGEGVYLYDTQGRTYIDASGGPLVVNVGHGVSAIAGAVAEQASRVAYVHGNLFTTDALETYSRRLAAKVPMGQPRFFYLCSGSEAVETALKFARQVQLARGEPNRDRIITRWGSYHGMTLGTLAVSGKPSMREPYAPMFVDMPHIQPPYCYRCPFDATYPACDLACARQLESQILESGPDRVAGFIAEPVGGATLGAIVPPDGYWPLVRSICDRYGVLLIADEVLTGFGRTGTWFALSQFGAEPDIMTMAKGAAGGYFPLSITAVRGEDVEAIRRSHGDFNHGGTFSHHAAGAAAALATLEILERQKLVERAASLGADLGQALQNSLAAVPSVGDIRGLGMMWAVEFVSDRKTKGAYPPEADFAGRVCAACMELGVLLYPGHGSVDGRRGDHLMVAPPYTVPEEVIGTIAETLRQAIEQVERSIAGRGLPA